MKKHKKNFNIHKHKQISDDKNYWIRTIMTFPLMEVVISLFLGVVFYFLFKKETLAELTWVLGPALSLSRRAYEQRTEDEFGLLKNLAKYVDLIQSDIGDSFKRIIQLYAQVSEPDFREIKDSIIKDAETRLSKLAHNKCSDELNTGEYFDWLFKFLQNTRPGERIWAISMNLEIEWNKSQEEENFLQLNLDAAARNVIVERIFVVPQDLIKEFIANTYIKRQLDDKSGNIYPLFVTKEHLEQVDRKLLKSLGEGIIAVDKHVVLIDIASDEGFRGIVTMNPTEIDNWDTRFRQLRVYASDISTLMSNIS